MAKTLMRNSIRRAEAQMHLQSAALTAAANAILITDRGGGIVRVTSGRAKS
jgi:hypothetical protein